MRGERSSGCSTCEAGADGTDTEKTEEELNDVDADRAAREVDPPDPDEGDASRVPWRAAEVVEGREFEEFRDEVDRAFPEDEVTFDELVSLSPEELSERSGGDPADDTAWDEAFGPDEDAEREADRDDGPADGPDGEPEDLLARLVDALASREPTEREREHLRAALGVDAPNSTEVRVRHLQSRLADLEAYVDAIEAFIDERGTARELLERLEARVDSQSDELATHAETAAELEARVDDLHRRVETTDSRVSEAESRLDDLEDRTATVEASQRWMREAFAAAAEDPTTAETED